jgi:hypothetical protein
MVTVVMPGSMTAATAQGIGPEARNGRIALIAWRKIFSRAWGKATPIQAGVTARSAFHELLRCNKFA